MLFRVLDIETVPDPTVWTPGEPQWVLKAGPRNDDSQTWFVDLPMGCVPCDVVYVNREPFPPPQAHKVVAISWCDVDLKMAADKPKTYDFAGCFTRARWSNRPDAERELLQLFRQVMVERPATLVTWNGRTFDLPVLAMRALHCGVPWGWYYEERDVRYRYSAEGHCDLMDFLSDYGAARQMKLGDAARLVGLPGKTDMDGSKVVDVVASTDPGNLSPKKVKEHLAAQVKIARYCLQDTIQTALLFVRSRYHLEIVTAAEYVASLKTFEQAPAVKDTIAVDWLALQVDIEGFAAFGGGK